MTEEEARQLFQDERQVAIVGGAVSGNVECLDFDKPELFAPFLETLAGVNPALREKLSCWQDTPNGGQHIIYRCSAPVDGSKKLAMDADNQTAIETRGEAAYFLVAPSRAASKVDGQIKPYILHGDIANLPILTPEERNTLLAVARAFDEKPKVTPPEMKPFVSSQPGGNRAGDILEREGDWNELLTEAGWKHVGQTRLHTHWQRPGKRDNSVGAPQAADAKFVVKLGVADVLPKSDTALWRASTLMSATASARRSRSSI